MAQLDIILQKIKNNQRLSPAEVSLYQRARQMQRGLPALPSLYTQTSGARMPLAGSVGTVTANSNEQDRGADPAWKAAHPVATNYNQAGATPGASGDSVWSKMYNQLDRGADPMRRPPELDRGADPMRNFNPGYAPTLDQEQALAQHNANSQGGTSYVPNNGSGTGTHPIDNFPGSARSGDNNIPFETKLPDVQMPNLPNVTLTWHDFTKQAQEKAAGAYKPLYDAINSSKTNATKQAGDSRAIIKGMYDDLARGNTADLAGTTAQYNATKAQTAKDMANSKATGQGAMASADQDLASLLASTGIAQHQGTAAQDTLATAVGDKSAAAAQADAAAKEAKTNLDAQQNNQLDYERNVAGADRSQGLAAGSKVVSDLANVLQQYDNQTSSTKADEMQQGLSLNQQMSQNDFGAQQGSNAETWNRYNAAMGQTQAQIGINQANAGLNNQAASAATSAATSAADLAQRRYEFDTTNAAASAKQRADQAQAQAELKHREEIDAANLRVAQQKADQAPGAVKKQGTDKTAPGYDPLLDSTSPEYNQAHNPYTIYKTTLAGIVQGTKIDPNQLDSIMRQVIRNLHGDDGSPVNQYEFADGVARDAQNLYGIPEGIARQAAAAFQRSLGTQDTTNPQPHFQSN